MLRKTKQNKEPQKGQYDFHHRLKFVAQPPVDIDIWVNSQVLGAITAKRQHTLEEIT